MDEEEFSLKTELEQLLELACDVNVWVPATEYELQELRERLQLLVDVVE